MIITLVFDAIVKDFSLNLSQLLVCLLSLLPVNAHQQKQQLQLHISNIRLNSSACMINVADNSVYIAQIAREVRSNIFLQAVLVSSLVSPFECQLLLGRGDARELDDYIVV